MATTRSDYPGGRQYLYISGGLGNTNNLFAWSEGTGQSKAVTSFQSPTTVSLSAALWSNDGLDSFVSFKLYNMTDDADLMVLDSAGNRVAYSHRTGASAEAMTLDLSAGTYYVRVLFANGVNATPYRIRLEGLSALVA